MAWTKVKSCKPPSSCSGKGWDELAFFLFPPLGALRLFEELAERVRVPSRDEDWNEGINGEDFWGFDFGFG